MVNIRTSACHSLLFRLWAFIVIMDNISLQADEIEALTSIYEDEIEIINEATRTYLFQISSRSITLFYLQVSLPDTYPSTSPPVYEFHAPWLKSNERLELHKKLDGLYQPGSSILYSWIAILKHFVESKIEEKQAEKTKELIEEAVPDKENVPEIFHGEPLTDHRSTFQAHLAKVESVKQVKLVTDALLSNRKIADATHNIVAYRVCINNEGLISQDCDDDGETAAGGRLLHLLQILDVKNVVVVVSRWFGGILLGPNRFKHIKNVARNLLVQQGIVAEKTKD